MNSDPGTTTARRRLGGVALFGLWAVAAAVSVGVGFGAVHMVGQEVIDDTPRTLSAAPSGNATDTVTDLATDSATEAPSTPSASSSATGSGTGSSTGSATGSTSGPTTGSRAGTSASRSPRPSPTRSATTPRDQTHTVVLTGGTVAVRCRGDVISLLYATPRDGYSMEKKDSGPRRVEVEFEGPGGESRLRASCSSGRLLTERR